MAFEHDSEEVSSVFGERTDVQVLFVELGQNVFIFLEVRESFQASTNKSETVQGFNIETLMVDGGPVIEISARIVVSDSIIEAV